MNRDTVWWEAFWAWFGASAMFCNFTALPILVYGVSFLDFGSLSLRTIVTMLAIAVVGFTLFSFVTMWKIVDDLSKDVGAVRHPRVLQSYAKMGKKSMCYTNPIGLVFTLFAFLWRKARLLNEFTIIVKL